MQGDDIGYNIKAIHPCRYARPIGDSDSGEQKGDEFRSSPIEEMVFISQMNLDSANLLTP
jgi:hypothetical protein